MPRQARLDAPGVLQHVMARGIERRKIFWDDKDRKVSEVGDRESEVRGRRSDMEIKQIKSAKDLRVYKTAYDLAMEIFKISKTWPSEERYSLTDHN